MSDYGLLTKGLREPELSGHDGPYLMTEGNDAYKLIRVNRDGDIIMEAKSLLPDSLYCIVENEYEDSFTVSLNGIASPKISSGVFPATSTLLVISDIEGNFNAFYGLLLSNGVIDLNYNWTFADNALVILGDVTDKGENVTQCLWLIYHLENQARAAGGRVHYLLGNHEIMDFHLDVRYVHEKYLALAHRISKFNDYPMAYHQLLEHNNLLTGWMTSKNCMEKIGDTLFVHAGVSPQLLAMKLSLKEINSCLRAHLHKKKPDEVSALLLGPLGPIWYRGLVKEQPEYRRAPESFIEEILAFYNVKRIAVGHTLVDNVSTDYHGKIIRTDVLHDTRKFSAKSQGLMIHEGELYRVDAMGRKENI
jgi:hypothetical protein